jgi:hypothetical protein
MLTWAERLTLWNQYEILKKLDPGGAKEYDVNQEILASGYELYYPEINPSIYEKTVSAAVGEEVQDILNMFRALKFSCNSLGYKPKSHWAEFDGFDGNDAGGQYGFARFLRRTLGRWEELKDRPDNSHSGVSLDRYRRMLGTWHRLGQKYDLSADEIEQMAEAN